MYDEESTEQVGSETQSDFAEGEQSQSEENNGEGEEGENQSA